MKVIPYEPGHIPGMNLQAHQAWTLSMLPQAYFEVLGKLGPAGSAVVDGRIVACAGIAEQGFGIGTLWAFVAADAGRHLVGLNRCTRRLLTLVPLRRIEATVEVGFQPGCRWLEILGFQSEGILRKYGQNGVDHWRYARV